MNLKPSNREVTEQVETSGLPLSWRLPSFIFDIGISIHYKNTLLYPHLVKTQEEKAFGMLALDDADITFFQVYYF